MWTTRCKGIRWARMGEEKYLKIVAKPVISLWYTDLILRPIAVSCAL